MCLVSDPNLIRLFYAIEHDHDSALHDPDIPLLPRLTPRMVNVLEHLAAEFLTVPGPEDLQLGETYDRQTYNKVPCRTSLKRKVGKLLTNC